MNNQPTGKHREEARGMLVSWRVKLSRLDSRLPELLTDAITEILSARDAEKDRACPCLHTTPCQPNCTCVKPFMSHGCLRCCSYGSPEQQRAAAEFLAAQIDSPRDAEIREVLEGLAWQLDLGDTVETHWGHSVEANCTPACLATQRLWEKLQPMKEGQDGDNNTTARQS